MLFLADAGLYIFHLLVTGFNLFGWIPRVTRRVHRWCVGVTAVCWFIAGAAVGTLGYCPLTDWHWRIKEARGETDLPSSFITYLLHQTGLHPAPALVDIVVGGTFAAIVAVTLALWWRERRAPASAPSP